MKQAAVFALAVVLTATIAGCAWWRTEFFPYEHPRSATLRTAIWAYPGDVDDLDAVDALYLGSMRMESRRMSSGDRIETAVSEAARFGGTHVILVDAAEHSRVRSMRSVVSRSGPDTVVDTARHRQRDDEQTFDIFYVSPHRWLDLPPALQP